METKAARRPSPLTVKAAAPAVGDAFLALRDAIDASSALDAKTRELVVLAGFVVARQEAGFKAHARRALANGATADELRAAALVTLGAVASIEHVADAITWADEVAAAAG
jgi:alkylhydroperoxidase/carboxymuconolactone decarboxylase family protein YurZ